MTTHVGSIIYTRNNADVMILRFKIFVRTMQFTPKCHDHDLYSNCQ